MRPGYAPLVCLLAVGCGTAALEVTPPDGKQPVDTSIPSVPPGDSRGDSADTGETGDTGGVDDATWQTGFFSDAVVHEVAITLSDASWSALVADPYEFTVGDVSFDGESVSGSGVRLRGKVGSFRPIDQKPKFKFDFGEFIDGQDLHGLKAIALNNEVVDCSYLKEPVAYRIFRDAGIPAPRTSFAHVRVNGEDYGLYVVIEVPDSRFLSDRLPGDDSGQLYDGKYVYYDDGTYTMLDFANQVDDLFQLEEGVPDGNAEIVTVSNRILATPPGFQSAMSDLVDWDELHTVFAVEQWIGHVDGYAMDRNNYRAYFRPSDQKMILIPWDFDYAFIEDYQWGMSWSRPAGAIAHYCWVDADCYASQTASMSALLGLVDTDSVLADYDAMAELTHDLAKDDPRRECAAPSVRQERASVRSWIEGRTAAMQGLWGL